ncbi:hypothetical protein CBR_g2914 [Chara braunii]|uniref:Uncharacterized protein n=1 Tax=Chara braunii TaxID=69332 RepID=A0A388KEB1_CHABU|nr:hypothetical protein CBR_g2914 [Chara braunii]|eukprot:GBG68371.1 hypothetical protein CBR_g2914 [Chara braunii]
MVEERRLRIEREVEEERRRKEEETRRAREDKRLLRQEERQKLEEERDARLLRIVHSEMRKERDKEREKYEKKVKSRKAPKKSKHRLGRMERKRWRGDAPDRRNVYQKDTGKIIEIRLEDKTEATVKIVETLRSLTIHKGDVTIYCSGGKTWVDSWRVVRRLFGETWVKYGKGTRPLRRCKMKFESTGTIILRRVTEASPSALALKDTMVKMFKNPQLQKKLRGRSLVELVRFYNAVKTFATKRSRTRARLMISRAVRESFEVNVRSRIIVKVQYDERIRKREIMRVVRRRIGGMQIDSTLKEMVKRRSRVV